MEENLRRSLVIAHGDMTVFLDRSVSKALLSLSLLLILLPLRKPIMAWLRGPH